LIKLSIWLVAGVHVATVTVVPVMAVCSFPFKTPKDHRHLSTRSCIVKKMHYKMWQNSNTRNQIKKLKLNARSNED